jgi:catalase
MLQGRLFSYGDAHRYRLGINHTQLPVNCPHAAKARNYGRDGAMRFDGNGGRSKNYEPNSYGGPAQSNEPTYAGVEIHGVTGSHPWVKHREDDDFVQAGMLYRVMKEDEKQRLVANIAGGLSRVSRDDVIERSIGHFRKADADYGERVARAVAALRAGK